MREKVAVKFILILEGFRIAIDIGLDIELIWESIDDLIGGEKKNWVKKFLGKEKNVWKIKFSLRATVLKVSRKNYFQSLRYHWKPHRKNLTFNCYLLHQKFFCVFITQQKWQYFHIFFSLIHVKKN